MLINGEKHGGVSLHYMTEKPDAGDIIAQDKYDILDNDTARSIHIKANKSSEEMLKKVLPKIIKGNIKGKPQNNSKASYFSGRKPEDGQINWNQSANQIRNLIRAVSHPYPGAFSYILNKKYIFWDVELLENKVDKLTPGKIISTNPLTIACKKGALIVKLAQQETGVCMSGSQLANDYRLV